MEGAVIVVCKSIGTEHYRANARYCHPCKCVLAGTDGFAQFKTVTSCSSTCWVRRAVMQRSGAVMDKFAGSDLTGAPVPLGIGAGGRAQPASGGRNGTRRVWILLCGDAVGRPLIGHIERGDPTQARSDAVLTDCGRSWGEDFSLTLIGRVASSCAISQLNDANVSDAGLPA